AAHRAARRSRDAQAAGRRPARRRRCGDADGRLRLRGAPGLPRELQREPDAGDGAPHAGAAPLRVAAEGRAGHRRHAGHRHSQAGRALNAQPGDTNAMNDAFYIAATGMQAQQVSLDTIANNLTNMNTVGYKRSQVSFSDLVAGVPAATDAAAGTGGTAPV